MFKRKIILLLIIYASTNIAIEAQTDSTSWDLRTCIDYATFNNIQVKRSVLGVEEATISYNKAKADRLPSLNATASQAFTNEKAFNIASSNYEQNDYLSGNYSLRSDLTIYNGGRINKTIEQQALNAKSSELSVKESQNFIEISVTEAYLQILYSKESVKQAKQTLEASEAQFERTQNLFDAGSISKVDFAQVKSQYASDKYNLIVSENNLEQSILRLKQILEIDISQSLELYFPQLNDDVVVEQIPEKKNVFEKSLTIMPEIENSELNVKISELEYDKAKANFLPSLSMNASLNSAYNTNLNDSWATQIDNNFYQNVGLTLSIPIFTKLQNKSALQRANVNIEYSQLNLQENKKNLWESIESAYLDAKSSQSRFLAAKEQLSSSKLSYELTLEQFNLGMKNTVELLTEKNKYLSAQQEYLQSKYASILNYKLLDFYQGKPIAL